MVREAIVVGSGAGGATAAKELQGAFQVTVLEAGREFRRLSWTLPTLERVRKSGLLLDEREIQAILPAMRIHKTPDMVLVNGIGTGGTTTLSTGNALRMDRDLRAIGIDLDVEFQEIEREIPISTAHQARWRPHTRRLFEICQEMGMEPRPTPKMGEYERCVGCGRCVLGCPQGVKWDSRRFLQQAVDRGARLIQGCRVERVTIEGGRATGVVARQGWRRRTYRADRIILAAGGLATPVILQNSGIPCESRLFVDPVLCVAARWDGALQCREVPMPFVVQRNGYIVSPYFDYLSFFFNRRWVRPARDTLALMIKLADEEQGTISRRELRKTLTDRDRQRLGEAVELCTDILRRFGIQAQDLTLGTVNAGHPGGMLPLTADEATTMHAKRLPADLYVADATLLPHSMGNPPILTIVALAKRVSRVCAQ